MEGFHRQLAGDLTDAQRATVLTLLGEAEAAAAKTAPNIGHRPRVEAILDDDASMAAIGVILSEWSRGVRTSEQALDGMRAIYAGRASRPRKTARSGSKAPG